MTRRPAASNRRRGAVLEDALLEAAWDELHEVGYQALTMEAVARRAGTSRPVLARRWGSKPELVIAAMRRHRPHLSGPVPDTGSLRGDVLALLRRSSAGWAELGPQTIPGLVSDYFAAPDLVPNMQQEVFQIGAEVMATILERAANRGEARPDVPPRVATLPIDLVRAEMFRSLAPVSDEAITEIVDEVFLPLVKSGR